MNMEFIEKSLTNLRRNIYKFNVHSTVNYINKAILDVKLPAVTKENVMYYYMPKHSLMSYTALSVAIMNPKLLTRLFPKRDVTDILFLSTSFGAGFWLWARPHMYAAGAGRRFSWAVVGGCLWPLGSIFMWAMIKSAIGQRPVIGTILGIASGSIVTGIAIDYFNYIESMFCGEIQLQDETLSNRSDDEKYDIDI